MRYQSVFRDDLFAEQNIIVTGGGTGIGRCTAHELARLGARVVLVGRRQEKVDEVAAEIIADGGVASGFSCDIRDESAVRTLVKSLVQEAGPVHGLVNNAGGQFPSPLALISQKGFETVLRTNLVGGFMMAREVYLQSMARHGGAIVNIIADMWGGMPMMGHSGAARAGMDNFTKTASIEWASSGVRVNAVAPGWIASSGMDTYDDSFKKVVRGLKKAVPLKRLGQEAEVSAAICFLLSPAAAFITGDTLRVDGGAPLASAVFPMPPHNRSKAWQGFHRAQSLDWLEESK
jgi:citronellol/citronellal dehydrogenase